MIHHKKGGSDCREPNSKNHSCLLTAPGSCSSSPSPGAEAAPNCLAGWLLFGSVAASLGSVVFKSSPLPASLLQMVVAALLFHRAAVAVRLQSLLFIVSGTLALIAADPDTDTLLGALTQNQAMIAMLAAVGSLRLVPLPTGASTLPGGRRALWQTMFGVHWLGSVINISAVVLFGDRMTGNFGPLSQAQALALIRGFALAALWSPFFVAMGVALSQVPGAQFVNILLWGLPLSQIIMALFVAHFSRRIRSGLLDFSGYPFNPATMTGPVLLASAVILAHVLFPRLSIVSLVTLAAPLYTVVCCRRQDPFNKIIDYIHADLPRMGSEVLLFLSAGVLGVGFTALVMHHDVSLPAFVNGPLGAALSLGAIIVLAAAGIHPIVGITVVAAVLGKVGISPDLLALSFLMGWGLGVIISPTSGTNLLLAGRYGISLGKVWRWQALFVSSSYLLCCAWLFLCDRFL